MNGKVHPGECAPMVADDIRAEILNPFVHNVELDTTFDKIKVLSDGGLCLCFSDCFRGLFRTVCCTREQGRICFVGGTKRQSFYPIHM